MEWYSGLYVGEAAGKKKKKIIRRLKINAGMVDVYVITLASNGTDLLDIISSASLKQTIIRRNLPLIVGIACGYEEAVEVAARVVRETYAQTGSFCVADYLTEK